MIYTVRNQEAVREDFPLSIPLFGVNHIQEPIYRATGFPFYQWFYCVKGKGEITMDQSKSIVSMGQGLLISPNKPHIYRGMTEDWTVHFFGFGGSLCYELLKAFRMCEAGVYSLSDPEVFPWHIRRLERLYRSRAVQDRYEFSKECYGFLTDLFRVAERIYDEKSVPEDSLLQRVVGYLERNYQRAVSLDELAKNVGMTKEYLCARFKSAMHQTMISYLTNIRIGHARIFLMQYPEKKIHEVAVMCGYENPSYFGRVFKRITGVTPEDYRKGREGIKV